MGLDRGEVRELAGVLAVFLLGLLLRFAPLRGAIVDGDVLFYGSDSFYHMRRVLYTVDHFPHTLWFDSYLNYPKGLELMWPPLFDQLIAGTALLLGTESQKQIEIVGAVVPPILGSLTIIVLYFLARELFGRRVGLLAALFLAINPQHASATIFGRPDHHVFETFLLVNIVLFLAIALKSRDKRIWFAVAAGVFMAALAYTWIGAAAYLTPFLAYVVLQTTLDLRQGISPKDELIIFAVAFGVALVLMLPFWKEPWLLPSFVAAFGILLVISVQLALSREFLVRGLPWIVFPLIVVVLGYSLLISAHLFVPSMGIHQLLDSGLYYFFGGGLSRKVAEAVPLYDAMRPLSIIGFNFTIAVMGFAHLWRSDIDRLKLLFLVWTVSILFLTIFQNRFLYVFSTSMSILMALFFFRAIAIVGDWEWTKRNRDRSKFFAPALLLLLILPSATNVIEAFAARPAIVDDSWNEPLIWLEENSIETRSFPEPNQTPEYGVLSWWDRGNWILYRSKRPVVANGFQTGAEDAARFFLSEDEENAVLIMDDRRSRYALTDSNMLLPGLSAIALWTGENPSDYVRKNGEGYEYTEKFLRTTLARCHIFDCLGMSHIRLIYESGAERSDLSANQVKIYERVSGARIKGTSTTVEPTIAVLNLTTDKGRRFQYTNIAVPQNGRYEMTIPYSTDGEGEVCAVGPYQVSSGYESRRVDVSEMEVLQGGEIPVNF